LAAAYGLVFVTGLGDGPHGANPNMEGLNIANGHVAWTFSTAGYTAMDPSVANRVVYVSDTSSDVYAVNVRTGKQIAVIAHLGTHGPTYPAVVGGWLYVSNYAFALPGS
jgi:outer membrane protein assembly factor BamB